MNNLEKSRLVVVQGFLWARGSNQQNVLGACPSSWLIFETIKNNLSSTSPTSPPASINGPKEDMDPLGLGSTSRPEGLQLGQQTLNGYPTRSVIWVQASYLYSWTGLSQKLQSDISLGWIRIESLHWFCDRPGFFVGLLTQLTRTKLIFLLQISLE